MGDLLRMPARPGPDGDPWEPWLTELSVARHFGVSERTVRRWRERGAPSRRLGGSRRYRISQLDQWLLEQEAS